MLFGVLQSRRPFHVVRSLTQALPLIGAFSLTVLALPLAGAHHAPRAQVASATPLPGVTSSALGQSHADTTPRAASLNSPLVLTVAMPTDSSVSGMINTAFGSYASQALRVAQCESSLNPSATNSSSGAAGVFQFMASTWAGTSYAGYSRYNAWANINAAHQVFVRDGYSWREWSCKP